MTPSIKTKKAARKVPPWKRGGGPSLSLMRVRDRLVLDFEYAPERVKAVKAIPGSRYNPLDKSWTVPVESLALVRSLKEFSPRELLNGLGPEDIEVYSQQEALSEIVRDPFSVREQAMASVLLDLLIRYNPEKKRVRIIPRIGSSALAVVKRFAGATFSAFDAAYVVPVERIGELLKKIRDKQISFAVDAHAGAALAGSASLRKRILASPKGIVADDLASALLTPFISKVSGEGSLFRPCFFTTEQFAMAFPGIRRQQGKLFLLDERGLLQFFGRMKNLPFSVWLTAEVEQCIEEKRALLAAEVQNSSGSLDDVAADLVTLPLVWRTSESGRGALVINLPPTSEIRALLVTRLSEIVQCEYTDGTEGLILEVPDSKLPLAISELANFCDVHDVDPIPKSDSFGQLEQDTRERVKLRERSAYYSALEDVSAEHVYGLPVEQTNRLFPHQRIAVQWLQETPYAFLGDDMGLGKTLSVLSYFSALRSIDNFSMLLVVCPNSLSRNWAREAAMWFPDLRVTVLAGDKASKAWALRLLTSGAVEYDILVVNYEAVRLEYVTPELEKLATSRKSLLCLDESQRVKNPSSKTFKAIQQIAPCCDRRVLLSGTPTPKDVSDLWAQMRILDGGERLGKSYYKWLGRVAELGTEYSKYAVKKFYEDEVAESVYRAHEVMLRRRKERVVNLPPKIFSIREIELQGSQAERYEEIRESLILRMRSLSGEQFVREITNILEEYLRAVQIASNPRLIDPEWKGDPAKFLELDEIVHELVYEQGQKIVVWTNYLGNVHELCERYKQFGAAPFSGEVSAAERDRTVRAFQTEKEPSILVAVPAAGGVGITLTAAQTAVYMDKTWNAEHWMQSVDRIHRIGQRGTVHVISLLGCKVDEIIHWNLRRKEQNQAKVLGDTERLGEGLELGVSREELLEALDG